jgi:hypothetical protein
MPGRTRGLGLGRANGPATLLASACHRSQPLAIIPPLNDSSRKTRDWILVTLGPWFLIPSSSFAIHKESD